MNSSIRRGIATATRILQGAWKSADDDRLRAAFEKHGPAWTVVSFSVSSRSPKECRKRWLTISGEREALSKEHPTVRHLIWEEGYELGKDGKLILFPQERIESSPLKMLARQLPRRPKDEQPMGPDGLPDPLGRPWTLLERMVVREAYEALGPNWLVIAQHLPRRTPAQVQAFMESSFAADHYQAFPINRH